MLAGGSGFASGVQIGAVTRSLVGQRGVLLFLQSLLDGGLAESTLRGYVAAISDCHIPVEGWTMGSQPLVGQFLKGARRI